MWIVFFLIFSVSMAHEVVIQVKKETAVVVEAQYADGTPFSYELYEVYSPENNKIPAVKGRTDQKGRIVFIPDKKGTWIVKAFSSDGHGFIKKIRIENLEKIGEGSSNRILKITIGAVITGGLLFMIGILIRRKR